VGVFAKESKEAKSSGSQGSGGTSDVDASQWDRKNSLLYSWLILSVPDDILIELSEFDAQSLDMLKRYIEDMKVLMRGYRLKCLTGLRSDNGGEYTGDDFKAFCKSSGIQQQFTGAHTPEENGRAERSWRSIANVARCLREQAGLPKRFWAEVCNTAAYLLNRMPTAVLGGKTSYYAHLTRMLI